VITVLGDAGVGKSRLAAELETEVGDAALALHGRCLPYGRGITYWPVAEMVRSAAGISESATADEAETRIASLLVDEADPDGRAGEDGPLVHGSNGDTPEGIEEAEHAIATAEHVLRLYVSVRAGPEEVQEFDVSVATGPDGVWFVSGHRDPDGEGEVWARRLGRPSLEVAFASLLSGPVVVPT
jgi:hypothetical protein